MAPRPIAQPDWVRQLTQSDIASEFVANVGNAEEALKKLADVYMETGSAASSVRRINWAEGTQEAIRESKSPGIDARYRALMEQIPAVVFMAYLDKGTGEAYVSPQIEAALGFSQSEWLENPIRWYQQIHPDDKERWSDEAAEMFISGRPLRSAYRVMAQDGKVLWFHCEAQMIRRDDGEPWFLHGVGFNITELKLAEGELQEERNVLSAILDTVGVLIVVLDHRGRIVRFNRACELTTGFSFKDVRGQLLSDLLVNSQEGEDCKGMFEPSHARPTPREFESRWLTRNGTTRLIAWSTTVLESADVAVKHLIATGIDITERENLQRAILEISGREQRRIGQDLHDGLGQHLTGIAFMSKVLEQKLSDKELPEALEAAKIVKFVNEAIKTTRELARGLLPVMADAHGLMSALKQWAAEVEDIFHIRCIFQCDEMVLLHDMDAATHLFHIAQEAVNNAIKHGQATEIVITLSVRDGQGSLVVRDNGRGIETSRTGHSGMGLRIISYRTNMVGGSSEVGQNAAGGTTVTCVFPIRKPPEEGGMRGYQG